MPSRSAPVRRRASSRTSRPSGSVPPMALFVGGAAVVVVILFLVLSNPTVPASAGQNRPPVQGAVPAAAPAAASLPLAGAKDGKTPGRPAPPLPAAALEELRDLLGRITALRNEAVTARTGSGDVQLARTKMKQAKELLDQWEARVEAPLLWQEEAQLGDWAQPAEYVTMESLFAVFQRLSNEVRKGGG